VPSCRIKDLNVLALCDSETERKIIVEYLQAWQMKSSFCQSLDELFKQLQSSHARDETYNFVYLDHRASVQKIMDLIERVRTFPEYRSVMFIIAAIFGSATASRILNSTEVGAFLTKPLFPDQLQDAFKILWDAQQNNRKIGLVTRSMITQLQNGEANKAEKNLSFHGVRVLVVEDMQVNQLLMTKVLEKFGCHIESATNGQKALDKLQEASFDIVFMDCQMPVMDGFEATRQIRKIELGTDKHTIIIALTADAMTGDREKCLNVGMDDYLNKPFKPEQIADKLRKWVGHN
jgi:CheY-like chemotaxis protein